MEAGSICGQGGGGSGAVDIWGVGGGVVVQNRDSPDFRSPEVGISAHPVVRFLLQCCTSVVSGLRAAYNTAALMRGEGGGREEGVSLSVCCPRFIILSYWMKKLY